MHLREPAVWFGNLEGHSLPADTQKRMLRFPRKQLLNISKHLKAPIAMNLRYKIIQY